MDYEKSGQDNLSSKPELFWNWKMMLLIISLGQEAQIRVAPGKPGSLEPHTVPDTVLSTCLPNAK